MKNKISKGALLYSLDDLKSKVIKEVGAMKLESSFVDAQTSWKMTQKSSWSKNRFSKVPKNLHFNFSAF